MEDAIKNAVQNNAAEAAEAGDIVLDLSQTRKKKIRVEFDDSEGGVIYLNLSDFNVAVRLKEMFPKLAELGEKAAARMQEDGDGDDESRFDNAVDVLSDIDAEMRAYIDYIFDSKISAVCAPNGSMYDLFNGDFRFEIIIEKISHLYGDNISMEYRKLSSKLDKHIGKYTRRKK